MAKPAKPTVYKRSKSKQYRPPGKRKEGNAAKYTTRNRALTTLQLKLPEFRRLCILKGIHPRAPKKKFAGHNKTYYHVKDINFVAHEPLLERGREIKAHEKKIKKARAKKCEELAQRLDGLRPTYTLDHLVKERYPSFIDALRDMDDPLTMLHLFATLPADSSLKIPIERVQSSRRLSLEWQAYITRTHSLRKTFVSVKGIYYQADVAGQKITWLAPHSLSQVLPNDVDYRVMLTFLEFYETLTAFVNFKLYHSLDLRYPPVLPGHPFLEHDVGVDAMIEDIAVGETSEGEEDEATKKCRNLFKDLRLFLAREVPRDSLLFVISSFGGTVSWEGDGAPFEESDESITHQIIDRPTHGRKYLSREYLQPQWVYDSANAGLLLPTEAYVLGRIPPPHLSPFVDNEAEGYLPEYGETIKSLQAASANGIIPMPVADDEDMDAASTVRKASAIEHSESALAAAREHEAAVVERAYTEELTSEIAGTPFSASRHDPVPLEAASSQEAPLQPAIGKDGNLELSRVMMPRKLTQLYKAMEMGKEKKKARVDLLKERKRKLG